MKTFTLYFGCYGDFHDFHFHHLLKFPLNCLANSVTNEEMG